MAWIGNKPQTYLDIKRQRQYELNLRLQRQKQLFGWLWNWLEVENPYQTLDNQKWNWVDILTADELSALWRFDNPRAPKLRWKQVMSHATSELNINIVELQTCFACSHEVAGVELIGGNRYVSWFDKNIQAIAKLYGKTHIITPFIIDGDIDLTQLKANESVCAGDGATYYFLLEQR